MVGEQPADDTRLTFIDITSFAHPSVSRPEWIARRVAVALFRGALWVPVFAVWALAIDILDRARVLPPRILDPLGIAAFVLIIGAIAFWAIRQTAASSTELGTLGSEADFPAYTLDRIVPHTGITLRVLLERTREFIFSLGSRPTSVPTPRDAAVKRLRIFAATFAVCALMPFVIPVLEIRVLSGTLVGALAGFIASASIVAGIALLRHAAALAQPSVEELRAVDRRRPVLLLRSFRDDRLFAWQRMRSLPVTFDKKKRFEQALARTLQQIGPLIAVGAPRERVPQLGAARSYLMDAEWQDRVLTWMDESLAIIMIAGTTEWIRWELHRAVDRGLENSLMILLPPDSAPKRAAAEAGRCARWQNVRAALEGTAWTSALAAIEIEDLRLLRLKADGHVLAITSRSDLAQDYQLAIILGICDAFYRPGG